MIRRVFLAAVAAAAGHQAVLAQKKNAKNTGPEVRVLEISARAESGRVTIDGKLRNTAQRPIRKLSVIFEVLDSDNNVLTRQQGPIDEPVLEPGDETALQVQMHYHARAVNIRLLVEDGSGRELRLDNAGPFAIE
jgi:hypothetical protein